MAHQTGRNIVLIICISLMLCSTWVFLQFQKPKKSEEPELKSTSILVMGADSLIPGKLSGWNGRSDLVAYVHLNALTKELSVLSIPRDTYINLPKYKIHKINSANAVGGYKLSRRAVKKLLKRPVDHVVVLSIQAVIDTIDVLGPMRIYVPRKMSYHDNSADLHIEIEPGLQDMDGATLMKFLRYRADKGDIGRIERQQIFFRSLMKKILEPELMFKIPEILYKANKAFLTDMSFKEMFELGTLLRSIRPENFHSYIVPGEVAEETYWKADDTKLEVLMQTIFKDESERNN